MIEQIQLKCTMNILVNRTVQIKTETRFKSKPKGSQVTLKLEPKKYPIHKTVFEQNT